ncbi:MAG: hypothetical protein IKN42_00165 [Elusimicrobia bacterium]|nr:hypothetical protein [Elusimicrobiota bacterium]
MAGFLFSFLSVEFKKKVFFVPVFIALWLSMIVFTKFVTNIHAFFYGNNFYENIALNVNVVAGFLALVYPLVFVFIKEQKNTKVFIAIMLFILFSIFITGCKIALILSFISTIIFLIEYREKKYMKFLILFSVIILISYIYIMFFLGADFDFISQRFVWWKTAYLIFKENIFFGCGFGNYSALFNAFRPEFVPNSMFAYNVMIQLLAEVGLLGLFSFIILLFAFYVEFTKKVLEEKDIYFHVYVAISVTSFIIINLFDYSFFVPANMLLFFIIFSSIFDNKNISLKKNRKNIFFLVPVCIIMVIFFIRPVIANTYYKKGVDLYVAGYYKVAIEEFEKAIKFDKKNPEYYAKVSKSYFALYDKMRNEAGQLYADKAVEYNKKAIDLYKYDAQLKESLASVYWNNDNKDEALKAIQEAIKYDKYNSDYEEYYYQIKNS